jgi:hypothetical protein
MRVCTRGKLATGRRALPERVGCCQTRKSHHQSNVLFLRVQRVGKSWGKLKMKAGSLNRLREEAGEWRGIEKARSRAAFSAVSCDRAGISGGNGTM